MTPHETPIVFECEGDQLIGIATLADNPSPIGVLIVVGGPQYRAGSHRHFVHLARALAKDGYSCFRFDYRGMGDSEGAMRSFEHVEPDIHAAVRAFRETSPAVERIVVFGLCDAASAVLMAAERIDGLAGMILANPWVRRSETLNAAVVRYYYRERLFDPALWRKLGSGKLPIRAVASEFIGRISSLLNASGRHDDSKPLDFIERMRAGWQLPINKLLLLSGRDITAREFEDVRAGDKRWSSGDRAALLHEERFAEADHTFSVLESRDKATALCTGFLAQLSDSTRYNTSNSA